MVPCIGGRTELSAHLRYVVSTGLHQQEWGGKIRNTVSCERWKEKTTLGGNAGSGLGTLSLWNHGVGWKRAEGTGFRSPLGKSDPWHKRAIDVAIGWDKEAMVCFIVLICCLETWQISVTKDNVINWLASWSLGIKGGKRWWLQAACMQGRFASSRWGRGVYIPSQHIPAIPIRWSWVSGLCWGVSIHQIWSQMGKLGLVCYTLYRVSEHLQDDWTDAGISQSLAQAIQVDQEHEEDHSHQNVRLDKFVL